VRQKTGRSESGNNEVKRFSAYEKDGKGQKKRSLRIKKQKRKDKGRGLRGGEERCIIAEQRQVLGVSEKKRTNCLLGQQGEGSRKTKGVERLGGSGGKKLKDR